LPMKRPMFIVKVIGVSSSAAISLDGSGAL
jgi:hypothetical protein